MGIEKMKIVGIIGKKDLLDRVLHQVILSGNIHMINALARVNSTDFFLPPTEKNIEALEEEPFLKPYSTERDLASDEEVIRILLDLFDIRPQIRREYLKQVYDYNDFRKLLSDIVARVHSTADQIEEKTRLVDQKREYIKNLQYLSMFHLDISRLIEMNYLVFRLIRISRENYDKLKRNYENIPAVILKVAVEGRDVIVASITPATLEETLEKIFSSLNYTILPVPREFRGSVGEITEQITASIGEDQKQIASLKRSLEDDRAEYRDELEQAYSRLEMEKKIEGLKSDIAVGDRFFFLFGFVPESMVSTMTDKLKEQFGEDLIILVDEADKPGSGMTPPTKLNNAKLFKPFETLVKMYGTPTYREKDPTVFFGLTYMLLFGAMFGDVGQGLVLFLGGLLLGWRWKLTDMGGILSRIGLSSTVFGFLYGSLFGSEEILPALLIRPMANINVMLITAVVLGIILLLSSYLYGIINAGKEKNPEKGLLGGSGLAGLIFYCLLLYAAYRIFVMHQPLMPVFVFIMMSLLILMLFKQPLSDQFFHSGKASRKLSSNDYIEEGFGIIEMLLSMLSNTISFLRVGAFALNHVGLYIAFATLAEMMKTSWGNWAVLIVGNIVILTLEALIVFIQALRLEYYELFTKYYRGDGIEYSPVRINGMSSAGKKKRSDYQKFISSVTENSNVFC